jgi:hypothetical protein
MKLGDCMNEIVQDYKILTHRDLLARGGDRVSVFVDKIVRDKSFSTIHGLVILDKDSIFKDKTPEELIEFILSSSRLKFDLETKQGITIKYPGDFYKMPEFGGQVKGKSLKQENAALAMFSDLLEDTKKELNIPFISIKINGRIEEVASIISVTGTPKADFALLNMKGEEVFWLSHKAGRKASDFQQWGGVTELSKIFKGNKEIENFIENIKERFGDELPKKTSIGKKIKDKKLKNVAVYGIEFGSKPGRQNVDVLLQGPINLVNKNDFYILEANHKVYNGDDLNGEYEPIFYASYRNDSGNFGIKKSRFMIETASKLKNKKQINLI